MLEPTIIIKPTPTNAPYCLCGYDHFKFPDYFHHPPIVYILMTGQDNQYTSEKICHVCGASIKGLENDIQHKEDCAYWVQIKGINATLE